MLTLLTFNLYFENLIYFSSPVYSTYWKLIPCSTLLNIFPLFKKLACLRSKKMLAAINMEFYEDNTWLTKRVAKLFLEFRRIGLPRCRRTLKVEWQRNYPRQELSRTKNHNLGALFKLDGMLLNPPAGVQSDPVKETSRKLIQENQETNEDHSHNDPHPKVGVLLTQSSQKFNPDETSYQKL